MVRGKKEQFCILQVDSTSSRSTALLLGKKAENLSKVAKLSETDLQNFFQVKIWLNIYVDLELYRAGIWK